MNLVPFLHAIKYYSFDFLKPFKNIEILFLACGLYTSVVLDLAYAICQPLFYRNDSLTFLEGLRPLRRSQKIWNGTSP